MNIYAQIKELTAEFGGSKEELQNLSFLLTRFCASKIAIVDTDDISLVQELESVVKSIGGNLARTYSANLADFVDSSYRLIEYGEPMGASHSDVVGAYIKATERLHQETKKQPWVDRDKYWDMMQRFGNFCMQYADVLIMQSEEDMMIETCFEKAKLCFEIVITENPLAPSEVVRNYLLACNLYEDLRNTSDMHRRAKAYKLRQDLGLEFSAKHVMPKRIAWH